MLAYLSPQDKGKGTMENPYHLNPLSLINTIIWNVRGANNAEFRRHCQAMINIHNTSVLALLKTRIGNYKALSDTQKS